MSERVREIVPGAPPPPGGIPLAVPEIGETERAFVQESLLSGWVAYGPFVDRFEEEICARLNVAHAIGVASGTAALHLALLAAGVEADDEVPVSALTFISPAFAIRYAGAWPVFIDAERRFRQLDPERLETFFAEECEIRQGKLVRRATGRRIGAVVAVDVLGHPADLPSIRAITDRYGIPLVEDAAEALGARIDGRPCGSFGALACLSFNGNKIITAGSGGMVLTDDDALARRVRYLATQAKDDPLEYVHGEVGFNYRLSNVHAALGYGQVLRLDEFVERKRAIASAYSKALADVPGIEVPREAPGAFSTHWLYTIHVHEDEYGRGSRDVLRFLSDAGIQARPLWQPLHRSPALGGASQDECPVADELHATGISLPCSVSLTASEQDRVAALVRGDFPT